MGFLDFPDPNMPWGEKFSMTPKQYKDFMRFLRVRAESSTTQVCTHLDHCNTFEGCIRAIHEGATSVMIDASSKPFKENVRLTKEVVRAAHACGVAVEGEIGRISGHPNVVDERYTTVEDAKRFYEETGVDLLAVSIGSIHGVLTTEVNLQYELMAQLRDAVPCGLVMHGASGMTEAEYKNSVENGVTKLNFASYLQIGMANYMREKLAENNKNMFAMEVNKAEIAGAKEIIKKHIGFFKTQQIE